MGVGLVGLAWRTRAMVRHSTAGILVVIVALWLGLLLLAFVLAVQVVWRMFGREETGSLPADRRLAARLDLIPTRAEKFLDPKYRLVFAHAGEHVGTVSVLTKDEGDAALALVRRILPT
jgi:hypothetical protein